jgi:hypothetical protein
MKFAQVNVPKSIWSHCSPGSFTPLPQPTPPLLVLDVVWPDEVELELTLEPPPGPPLVELESPPWPLLVAIVDAVDDVVAEVTSVPPVPGAPDVAPELNSSSPPRPPHAPAVTMPAPSNAAQTHGAPRRNDPFDIHALRGWRPDEGASSRAYTGAFAKGIALEPGAFRRRLRGWCRSTPGS